MATDKKKSAQSDLDKQRDRLDSLRAEIAQVDADYAQSLDEGHLAVQKAQLDAEEKRLQDRLEAAKARLESSPNAVKAQTEAVSNDATDEASDAQEGGKK